ncbi:MAG: primosomal protein N' [Planctomycetes bacterium]|nr:primosomal protein N' [Planctomycetota bacterium]
MRFAQVALNLPVADAFDYAVPPELQARLRPGLRVRVPFRNRTLTGYCVRLLHQPTIDPARVKPIAAIVDDEPLLDDAMLELTRWVADYYACSWGEALEAALPAGVRHKAASRTIQVVEPVLRGAELRAAIAALPPRLRKRAALLETLASCPGEELTPHQLAALAGCSVGVVHAARKDGQLSYRSKLVTEHPVADVAPEAPKEIALTEEQQRALAVVRERRKEGFAVVLLHGVTGSGKTEVYLRAIADALADGKQAIVLVPEISLTPQTISRFKARFGRIAVLHSHLTPGQRCEQWLAIRRGEAQVVIGPRSAVFAPVHNLGIVVVDEEHENTFKQEEPAPRYHARDVAILRAQRAGALVVLGSATPSLESFNNARRGKYAYVLLAHRVLGLRMPPVEIVDMTEELAERKRMVFISRRLEALMKQALAEGGQVMLFLNRRGFSTLVYCPRCHHALSCPKCKVPVVFHRRRNVALCHYCGEHVAPPGICPACRVSRMLLFGAGTERIEDEIARKFPAFPLARMDSDTTRGRAAHATLLDRFRSGQARILIGTQMIAKGLDFPQVTLVGVVSADTALYLPDFRAAERTYQLVEQVAGRAGRGTLGGRVIVQTTNPHHLSIVAASRHDYRLFADTELGQRLELGYPPFGHVLRVVVTAARPDDAERRAADLARRLTEPSAPSPLVPPPSSLAPRPSPLEILGPVECPLANLKGRSRWQLLIKAPDRRAIHAAAHALRPLAGTSGKATITLDVDPISML